MSFLNNAKSIKQKSLLFTWIIYHSVILLLFLIMLLAKKPFSISADLTNILPKTFSEESINKADQMLTASTSSNIFILVSNKDFSKAKEIADKVYTSLGSSPYFDSITLYNDDNSIDEALNFIFQNRWNLLDSQDIETLQSEGASYFSDQALTQIFGGITMTSLDNLEEDPYLLTEVELKNYLSKIQQSGIGMTAVDGVLAQQQDGLWYVMIRGVLNKKGAAMASKKNGITQIYNTCALYENEDTQFIFSGTPFHSHESSNSAAKEILLITIISLLCILTILFIVFKSPIPIVCSFLAISVSILTAFAGTLSLFKTVHVIAFVFGTSLIGSCIDYSLHYFIHWACNAELKTGTDIRNYIFKGLFFAIISSCLCFAILLFAPFTLLKQISTFCLLGLTSSYLTTICIYPFIKLPAEEKRKPSFYGFTKLYEDKKIQNIKKFIPVVLFVFSISTILICHKEVRVKNNISGLYNMKGRLLSDEILAAKIIQYSPTGWFILRANSEEELLQKEEQLSKQYEALNTPAGYICTSLFVPSKKTQQESRAAVKILLDNVEDHFAVLGFEEDSAEITRQSFIQSENDFITPYNCPEIISSAIQNCWLGNINGQYYSIFIPSKIYDEAPLRNLVQDSSDIYFINKSTDISKDLDKLTYLILIFFAVSFVILFITIKFFYTWKESLRIISVPLFILLMIFAIFGLCKIKLEFFSITGIVLVFGLGIDYIIYVIENNHKALSKGRELESFAILLSFVTTIISFGCLALSSFQPVHLIGLSICVGLSTAYLSSVSGRGA